MRGGDGVSDVEIRRNEIIELLYTYKKYSIDDFAKRFGVSRRTINYDIVYLMDFYEIDTKPGPHGGISLIDRRPNSHTAYLKPIEIEWLRRKYNEAETEEDRMAAHSILKANIAESTDGKGEDEEATKQLTAQDLLIKEYDDILTARIIEKVIVHSRQEIEIYFIGGYTQKIDLI